MKFKVICLNGASSSTSTDASTSLTFYVLAEAIAAATIWAARGDTYHANVWDGETWRAY